MHKKALTVGILIVLAVAVCMNAYAADGGEVTAWHGFWNSVGGFVYNAMPWNWSKWMGQ